jgi:hypothetical protein
MAKENRMLRRILKIFGISLAAIAAFAGVLALIVLRMTAPVVDLADRFMAEISAGNPSAAYAMFTEETKRVVAPDSFAALIVKAGYAGATDISWGDQSLNTKDGAGKGETDGKAILSDGRQIAIHMEFRQSGGVWRVNRFDTKLLD